MSCLPSASRVAYLTLDLCALIARQQKYHNCWQHTGQKSTHTYARTHTHTHTLHIILHVYFVCALIFLLWLRQRGVCATCGKHNARRGCLAHTPLSHHLCTNVANSCCSCSGSGSSCECTKVADCIFTRQLC